MSPIRVIALALLLAAATAAAADQPLRPLPPGGLTLNELRDWFQERGYRAKIVVGDNGKSYIDSMSDGFNFSVDLYDCDKEFRCSSMQVYAYFRPDPVFDPSVANRWNETKRWAAAYMTPEGRAVIQQDINLPSRSSYDALEENMDIWYKMLSSFAVFAYEKVEPSK